ncbi:hypothetical protein AB0C18_09750 [Nonomuraea muscovyensis]|uniref:hypothetical protein n=1 Tax=Nonomuraea muscovyensis TaxID=1124761 RepID=UPI00340D8AD8
MWDEQGRLLVVNYLENGMGHMDWMGISMCRFCGQHNGASDFTDGVYVWPEGLSHYLKEHGVRLPSEFVAHVMARIDVKTDGGTCWRTATMEQSDDGPKDSA